MKKFVITLVSVTLFASAAYAGGPTKSELADFAAEVTVFSQRCSAYGTLTKKGAELVRTFKGTDTYKKSLRKYKNQEITDGTCEIVFRDYSDKDAKTTSYFGFAPLRWNGYVTPEGMEFCNQDCEEGEGEDLG